MMSACAHKDNAGLVVASIAEHFADEPRTLANVFVHDSAGHNLQEAGVDVGRNGTCTVENRYITKRVIEKGGLGIGERGSILRASRHSQQRLPRAWRTIE